VSAPRFRPGEPVRVRRGDAPGHIRTPAYVRGHAGVVERICGSFPNPEELAYNRVGPPLPLYRVRFPLQQLWPEDAASGADSVEVEIYEHWLEPA
jgi:nitrile hydratase